MKRRIIFDKSVYGATRAGVYVFAEGLLNAFKQRDEVQVMEYNNPFSTLNKTGVSRKFTSLLRLLYVEFIVFSYKRGSLLFFPAPEMSLLAALFRLNYAITIHDLFTWENSEKTTFFARWKQRLLPFYAKHAQFIVTVSEFSKSEIVKILGISPKKIVVCPNGLSLQMQPQDEVASSKFYEKYTPYILFIGSSEPRKNLLFLMDVFDELNSLRTLAGLQPVNLVMTCGESWSNESLHQRILESPYQQNIVKTGYVSESDKVALYQNANVTTLPSLAEGFGIPVIESLALGTPVIVQNNTALSMFSDYGAIVRDTFDKDQWAECIHHLILQSARVAAADIHKVHAEFTWERSAAQFIIRWLA